MTYSNGEMSPSPRSGAEEAADPDQAAGVPAPAGDGPEVFPNGGADDDRSPTRRDGVKARRIVVFVHVPKTAGTTVTDLIHSMKPASTLRVANVFKAGGGVVRHVRYERVVERLLRYRRAAFVYGHIPFGIDEYLPRDRLAPRYFTFLRDPVDRALSHYYQRLALVSHPRGRVQIGLTSEGNEGGFGEDDIPSDYAPLTQDTPIDQAFFDLNYVPDNLQTRMLCGLPEPFGEVTEEMLEQATRNLESRFVMFGLVERFDESLVLLKQRLGYRNILYEGIGRVSTARPRDDAVPSELRTLAERANRYDAELYRFATQLFDRAPERQHLEFQIELAALRHAQGDETAASSPPSLFGDDAKWRTVVEEQAASLRGQRELAAARLQKEKRSNILAELDAARERTRTLEEEAARVGAKARLPRNYRRAPGGHSEKTEGSEAGDLDREASITEAENLARSRLDRVHGEIEALEPRAEPTLEPADAERLQTLREEAKSAETRIAKLEARRARLLREGQERRAAESGETDVARPRSAAPPKKNRGRPATTRPVRDRHKLDERTGDDDSDGLEERSVFFDRAERHTDYLCAEVAQVEGARLLVKTQDKHIGRAIFVKRGRGDISVLRRCVTVVQGLFGNDEIAGRTLIDIGANIGTTTIPGLLSLPFADGLALEPEPENFITFRLNLLLNRLEGRVTALQAAASNAAGELNLMVNASRSGKHWIASDDKLVEGAKASETPLKVPTMTLNSLAGETYDVNRAGLLWVDAENHEGQILEGATELLRRGVPVAFEWDRPGLEERGDRAKIEEIIGEHYTHFMDLRGTGDPERPRYELCPVDGLGEYGRPTPTGEEHFTDILVLRLSGDHAGRQNLDSIVLGKAGTVARALRPARRSRSAGGRP